jgi:hypothetical protein
VSAIPLDQLVVPSEFRLGFAQEAITDVATITQIIHL